jgi:hypothetical protein
MGRQLPAAEQITTVSQYGNLCAVCHYRWQRTDAHCGIYEEEPRVCLQLRIDALRLQQLTRAERDLVSAEDYEPASVTSASGTS